MNALCRPAKGVLVREAEGQVLVLDPASDRIHQLNETASFIWRTCQEVASAAEVAKSLAENFEVEEDKARADAERTIDELKALGIIRG